MVWDVSVGMLSDTFASMLLSVHCLCMKGRVRAFVPYILDVAGCADLVIRFIANPGDSDADCEAY